MSGEQIYSTRPTAIPGSPQPSPQSNPTQASSPSQPAPNNNSNGNTMNGGPLDQINNEYMMLRVKVEDRIKELEGRCVGEDAGRTRVSLGRDGAVGEYGDQRWRGHEHYLYGHMSSNQNYHHGHLHRSNGHMVSNFKQCPVCQHHSHSPYSLNRNHCYSLNSQTSNTHPYLAPPTQSIYTPPTGFQPRKNPTSLPLQSNASNSQTFLNPNINEAILENLKYQKEINTNLKALSEKLSDFSVKRSESSGFVGEAAGEGRGRGFGGCWDCEHAMKERYTSNGHHGQKSRLHRYRTEANHQKYIEQGYESSSESQKPQKQDQKTPKALRKSHKHQSPSKAEHSHPHQSPNKSSKNGQRIYPSYRWGQNSNKSSKHSNSVQGRAKSVSVTSQNSKNKKLYTFRAVRQSPRENQTTEVKIPDRNRKSYKNFDSEYFQERGTKRNTKKREHDHRHHRKHQTHDTDGNGNHYCPLHTTNEVIQMYENRQRKRDKEIYRDAQHRNRKHERDHMLLSFQQQEKLRKELVDKISRNFFNSYGVK